MIFLFILLQFEHVLMEITKCEQIPFHPDTLYPTNSNTFIMSLDNFFHGEGLTYSVVNSTQFKVSQSIAQIPNPPKQKYTYPFSNGTRIIDEATQTNWTNPNYQTGTYAVLVETNGIYYVYLQTNTTTPNWSQLRYGFSNVQTALCINIAFIFDNDLLISCITREEGFQIFYYIQQATIKILTIDIPIIIRVDTTIFQSNTLEFSYLQVLNDRGKNIYVTVAHGNYYNPTTYVFVYRVEFKRDVLNPSDILDFSHHYVGSHKKSIYGVYQANEKEMYLLYEDELVKHDLRRPLDSNTVLMKIKYGQGMGAYKETYTNEDYNVFITIVTTKGLEFYSTSNLQSDQKPDLPDHFITNKRLSIKVNLLYSLISNGEIIVVYENRYSLKDNRAQYGLLSIFEYDVLNILYTFNTLNCNLSIYTNTTYYQYQLQTPYLYSVYTGSQNYSNTIEFQLMARAYNGLQCYCNLNFILINPNEIYNFVTLSDKRERKEPILLFNSQSKLIRLSNLFIGGNLNYTQTIKQILQNDSILEPQIPQVSILQIVNVDLIENLNIIIFTYTYQIDSDTYYIFTQRQNDLRNINIQKCKFIGCYEQDTIYTQIRLSVVSIAAHIENKILHVIIGYQQQVISYDYDYNNLERIIKVGQSTIQEISKSQAPSIQIQNVYFINEAILILTTIPNSIICVNTLLHQQYILSGNGISPRQIFINSQIYNDTYFVDNQYELLIIQQTKNLEIKEFTRVLYGYNILTQFSYPNNYKQQQITIGIIKQGIYLVQVTARASNIYFYPFQYLFYEPTISYKSTYQIQTIRLYQYSITISQPFISGYSNNQKFYLLVQQNQTNLPQLFVIQPSPYEFSQLYTIINLQQQPSQINIISIQRELNQFRDELLDFQYDILILLNQSTNQINAIQIFDEATLLYTPNIQQNTIDEFEVNVIAINNFNGTHPQKQTISREFKTTKLELGIIERENQVPYNILTTGSIFQIQVNPADFFYGYASNYTVINKIGLRLDLQDVFIDCFQKQKKHQVIKTSVIEPMMVEQANFSIIYDCVFSGILNEFDYVQTFIQSGRSIYILFDLQAYYLYQVPAPLESKCIYSFITSDTGYLITICTNEYDTYFYYYNGTFTNNRTMFSYTALNLTGTPLPNLLSAQFQYNILALQYKEQFITYNVSANNVSMNLSNQTTYKYIYPLKSYSLFIIDLVQLENKNSSRMNSTNKMNVIQFLQNIKPGIMFLYENTILEINFNNSQHFASYQSKLPNGLQLLSVLIYDIGWITNTYVSVPFIIATNTASYYFQVTVPIIEREGRTPTTYLIYKLISYNRYQTLGVYTGGEAIVGLFYTNSSEIGQKEYIFGLYGIPSFKDYTKDKTLQISFDPERVYQHVGQSVGFIGIKNHSNYDISNPIITSNQTMLYQVNQTLFQYIYLNTQLVITINQVECINSTSIHHALNQTIIELIATNNQTKVDFSRNSFLISNNYPPYTFYPKYIRRNFWWQFGVGVIFFSIITGVLIYLCVNSNKIIVYQERFLEPQMDYQQ